MMKINTTKLMKLYRFAEHQAMGLVRAIREHIQKNQIQDHELDVLITNVETQAQTIKHEKAQHDAELSSSPKLRPFITENTRACQAVREALEGVVKSSAPESPRAEAAQALLMQHFQGERLNTGKAEARRAFTWALLEDMQQRAEVWAIAEVAWTQPRVFAAHEALHEALKPIQDYTTRRADQMLLNERISQLVSYIIWRGAIPENVPPLAGVAETILAVNAEVGRARD